MSSPPIEVTIERLVLEGLPPGSHLRFVGLFTGHLERALVDRALSRGSPAKPPAGPLSALAFHAAQAVTSKVLR